GQAARAQLRYLHDGALHLRVQGAPAGDAADAAAAGTAGNGAAEWPESAAGMLEFAPFDGAPDTLELQFAGERLRVNVYVRGEVAHIFSARGATQITALDVLAHAGEDASEGGRLSAPMPGKVVSFAVQPGERVRKGQPLAVLEAMKMEHTIAAPTDGVVQELLYAPGDQVAEGDELLKLSA
ncbi:MAG: biotin/lipoyl-containing protein, partial [Burkholderiaceae bacterium]